MTPFSAAMRLGSSEEFPEVFLFLLLALKDRDEERLVRERHALAFVWISLLALAPPQSPYF